uniref:Uncharacterized protein n=1 Tax=Glossina pallidipes TaxID=7398 RepID=A0A1B0AAK5_GLOPL
MNKKKTPTVHDIQLRLLKMSLVPLPCQECQLESSGSVNSESVDWLFDLKDGIPIWSRLLTMNTSGYTRNIVMSMAKKYHVEIEGRLWSLWGHMRSEKPPICNNCYKPFLAVTVMGLCAARIFRLNLWRPSLLDNIRKNGEKYFEESLKDCFCPNGFDLCNLLPNCSLEGVRFNVHFKTALLGNLYSPPTEDGTNLAFGLMNFFRCHQFGILECFNRYLAFGYICGTPAGYFMYDAQSMNYPLFLPNKNATYILRTNHLQILLYCLIIALNVKYQNAPFALHSVNIKIACDNNPPPINRKVCICCQKKKRILPEKYWNLSPNSSECDIIDDIIARKEVIFIKPPKKVKTKYEHVKRPSMIDKCLQEFEVFPLVETKKSKEDCKEEEPKREFLRYICSQTDVPLTAEEKAAKISQSFCTDLNTVLATGLFH